MTEYHNVDPAETSNTPPPTFWAAPDLAKAGFLVFPVRPDKVPRFRGGFYRATRDLSQIAAWIEEGHGHDDIAMPTGLPTFTVVIDADTPKAYARMVAAFGDPVVKTARGGHWYYAHPQDGRVISRKFAPGLDCKADGGYVLIPPSTNRTWTGEVPNLGNLPRLPKKLRAALHTSHGGARHDSGHGHGHGGEITGEIPSGNRNGALTSLAGTMRRRGMGEAEIYGALEVTNRLRCKPPLPEEEVRRICASVARYEPSEGSEATDGQPWWVRVVAKNG